MKIRGTIFNKPRIQQLCDILIDGWQAQIQISRNILLGSRIRGLVQVVIDAAACLPASVGNRIIQIWHKITS